MSFALFFLAEHVNMVTVSAVATNPCISAAGTGRSLPDRGSASGGGSRSFPLLLFFYARWTADAVIGMTS